MKVIDWISDKEADSREESVGGLGGFFNGGPMLGDMIGGRWNEYITTFKDHARPYLEALRAEIVAKRIRNGGFWHQDEYDSGTPVFEDGTVGRFSLRAWGDLLAAVWSEDEDRDYSYTAFAWYGPEEKH